jgi:branched-subunit amino acid ABC-type transport system permease component
MHRHISHAPLSLFIFSQRSLYVWRGIRQSSDGIKSSSCSDQARKGVRGLFDANGKAFVFSRLFITMLVAFLIVGLSPFLSAQKKKYCGMVHESTSQKRPVFEAKGIETVRMYMILFVAAALTSLK